jgi:hypothetical protein
MAPRQRSVSTTPTEESFDSSEPLLSSSTSGVRNATENNQQQSLRRGRSPPSSNIVKQQKIQSKGKSLSSSVDASYPTEADIARDKHDYFNVVALVRLNATG